jgi:hypothetical protein
MKRSSKAVAEQFVVWLSTTKMGTLTLWFVESIAFGLGALVMMFILYHGETRLFPVITDWKINPVIRQGDTYVLEGTMNKTRSCTLIATNVMAVPKMALAPRVLLYRIKPTEIDGGNIPTGSSTWGPWTMNIPKAFLDNRDKIAWIDVIGQHRCHGFWDQETYYGRVEMEQLP